MVYLLVIILFVEQFVNQLRTGVYHALISQLFIRIKSTIISVTIWNSLLELLWREIRTGLYLYFLRWLIKAMRECFLICSLNIISCSHNLLFCSHKKYILFPQHIIRFPQYIILFPQHIILFPRYIINNTY